jgi:excisionase family DNA binding protein
MTEEGHIVATYTTAELAALLGLSEQTVRKLRRKRQGPRFVTIGDGTVRYLREDVDKWIAHGGDRGKR